MFLSTWMKMKMSVSVLFGSRQGIFEDLDPAQVCALHLIWFESRWSDSLIPNNSNIKNVFDSSSTWVGFTKTFFFHLLMVVSSSVSCDPGYQLLLDFRRGHLAHKNSEKQPFGKEANWKNRSPQSEQWRRRWRGRQRGDADRKHITDETGKVQLNQIHDG